MTLENGTIVTTANGNIGRVVGNMTADGSIVAIRLMSGRNISCLADKCKLITGEMKPQERRYAAMRGLHQWSLREIGDNDDSRAELASAISSLEILGRSQAWRDAIRNWSRMVADERNSVRWAYLQGSVYVSHAA